MWVINNQILSDPVYSNIITDLIKDNLHCPLYTSEPLLWWDNLKYKIKKCSVSFSCKKRREERAEYYHLQRLLRLEYERLAKNPLRDTTIIQNLEKDLEIFEKIKCEGAILRSKAQWALEADRNTSFFLNLEKAKKESNCIRELFTDNGISNKTEDILDRAFKFYSKLYTAEDVDISKQDDLLDLIEEGISEEDKVSLDTNITVEEISSALHCMKRNKSPGQDGLTTEF